MPQSFVSFDLQVDERKVYVLSLDTMEESISFFNELETKKELCSRLVLFFKQAWNQK